MLNPTIMALSRNREQSVLNAKLQDSLLGKNGMTIIFQYNMINLQEHAIFLRGNNIYCLPI